MVVEAVSCEEQPQKMMNKPGIKKRIPTRAFRPYILLVFFTFNILNESS